MRREEASPGASGPMFHIRIVLTGLLAVLAALLLSTAALAAPTVTVDSTTSGVGADTAAGDPPNRTEDRSTDHVDFTVTGATVGDVVTCSLDGAAPVACGTSTTAAAESFSYATGELSLGSHTVVITTPWGGATYLWRIEPPQYGPLVLHSAPYAYWNLDDAASATTALDSSGHHYDGEYKNFPVKRQPAGPICENQPHPPWACDWAIRSTSDPTPVSLDDPATNSPSGGQGRDRQGWSAYFGGRDDQIEIENMPNPSSSSWTIEAWVKPSFSGQARGIFQHVPSLWAEPGSAPGSTHFACSGLNDETNAVTSADIPSGSFSGTWFHVACVYSAGTYRLYVNNVRTTRSTSWVPGPGGNQGFIGLVNKTSGQWWKGDIDDVAYYDTPLSGSTLRWHDETGSITESRYTSLDHDLAPPSASDISSPANNAQYSPDAQSFKRPYAQFSCGDVQPTSSVVTSCSVSIDGGAAVSTSGTVLLPLTPGVHTVTLTAVDTAGLRWTHTHRYFVHQPSSGYPDMISCVFGVVPPSPAIPCDPPIAYYRLNDAAGAPTMVDASPNHHDGIYKNDQDAGGPGVTGGTPNNTRAFFGKGGYAYVNGIAAPQWGYTLEAWWKPADNGGMAILQHGSNGTIWYDGSYVYFRPDERAGTNEIARVAVSNPATGGNWFYVAGSYDGVNAILYVQESTAGHLTLLSNTVAAHYQDGAGSADTLYLGFANDVGLSHPWLRGSLDEVAYYPVALSGAKLTQHFNADPPAGDVEYTPGDAGTDGTAPPATTTITSDPAGVGGDDGDDASPTDGTAAAESKAAPHAKPASALATAKAKVTSLTKALTTAKAKVKKLRTAHARAAAIRKANARVASLTTQLAKERAKVRALTPKAKKKLA